MAFLERPPRGRLRGVVERLWLVDDPAPSADAEPICPDGTTEIVLHVAEPMRERRSGVERLQPRVLLVGQMQAPIVIAPSGRVSMVGARFAAGAFRRVVRLRQDRLAGAIHDLEPLLPIWTRETVDRVAATTEIGARLDVFEAALERIVPDTIDPASRAMQRVVARMRFHGGHAAIDGLAREAGVSRRQFERRFREQVGLSPQVFARILKFQQAFAALTAPVVTETGADIAARCGYADQAHMVREIRRFAGQTPTVLARAEGLTAFFRG
jgi:AraC-like DNA-binding protein